MDVLLESKLSTELQELYLENKEWMSQVLFFADENRFFQKLFGQKLFLLGKNHSTQQINLLSQSLANLNEKIVKLKSLISLHQQLLESILKDAAQKVGIQLIEEHTAIAKELEQLFLQDRQMKSKLFLMVEEC